MKPIIAAILTLLSTICLSAQTLPCTTSSAIVIDSFYVSVTTQPNTEDGTPQYGTSKGSRQMSWVTIVYSTGPAGVKEYSVRPESIQLLGDPDAIDSASTQYLFNQIAFSTASQGAVLGFTSCWPEVSVVTVHLPACAQRSGSGEETRFAAGDPFVCYNLRCLVSCMNGPAAPLVSLLSIEGELCSAAEEPDEPAYH